MGFNVTVDVYSVVAVRYDDVDRLKAYLYDHTTVVDLPGYSIGEAVNHGDKQVVVLLKTTNTRNVYDDDVHKSTVQLSLIAGDAHRLANYQLDRLASGLLPGLLCGNRNEAEEVAADVLSNLASR